MYFKAFCTKNELTEEKKKMLDININLDYTNCYTVNLSKKTMFIAFCILRIHKNYLVIHFICVLIHTQLIHK